MSAGWWLPDMPGPSAVERLHRQAVVGAAAAFALVVDGQVVRFTSEEATRLGFLVWRLETQGERHRELGRRVARLHPEEHSDDL